MTTSPTLYSIMQMAHSLGVRWEVRQEEGEREDDDFGDGDFDDVFLIGRRRNPSGCGMRTAALVVGGEAGLE